MAPLLALAIAQTSTVTWNVELGSYSAHALVGRETLVVTGTTHTASVDIKTGKLRWWEANTTQGMNQLVMRTAATKSCVFVSSYTSNETTIDIRDIANGKLIATVKMKGPLDDKVVALDEQTFGFVPTAFGEPTMHAIGSKNWTPTPAANRVPFQRRP